MRATFRETTSYRTNFLMSSSGSKEEIGEMGREEIGGFSSIRRRKGSSVNCFSRFGARFFLCTSYRIGKHQNATVRSDGNEKSSPRNGRLYALSGEA